MDRESAKRVEGVVSMIWDVLLKKNKVCCFSGDVLGGMFGEIAYGLCLRAEKYNPEHESGAKFSTFAYGYIYDKTRTLFRAEINCRKRGIKSLDSERGGRNCEKKETLYDDVSSRVVSPYREVEIEELSDIFRRTLRALSPLDRRIIKSYYFQGNESDDRVKKALGLKMSRVNVNQRRQKAFDELQIALRKEGVDGGYLIAG